jgi:hypothetical protein
MCAIFNCSFVKPEINNALEENIVLTENTEKISEYPSTYEKINENDVDLSTMSLLWLTCNNKKS